MKIYNKHNFIEGLFMLLLALLGFGLDIIKHEFEIRGIVISGMLLFGITSLVRSFSRNASSMIAEIIANFYYRSKNQGGHPNETATQTTTHQGRER